MMISVEYIRCATYISAGLCIGLGAIATGIGLGTIAGEGTKAITVQPKSNEMAFRTMLTGQAITETGAIFALVISLLLLFGGMDKVEGGWFRIFASLGAGLGMGIGSLGPSLGAGYSGGQACSAIGRMPKHSSSIMGNMLIGQALSQTSAIFALVISFLLLYSVPNQPENISTGLLILKSASFLGAGLAIGLGTIGPGSGIGYVAGRANDMLGRFPKEKSKIMRTMFLGAAVAESTAIYSLVVAMLLIFAI